MNETETDMNLSRNGFLYIYVAVQVDAENSSQQPGHVDDQHAVHYHLDGTEEAETFLQPTFIGIISELSAITEGVLLPDSAHIEAEAKVCLTITVHGSILQFCMLLMQHFGFRAYMFS